MTAVLELLEGRTVAWQTLGACHNDPELFFPPDGERAVDRRSREREAKEVCAGCSVLAQCREASVGETIGVWAGVGDDDRTERARVRRAGSLSRRSA